jgi:hypothetical protein
MSSRFDQVPQRVSLDRQRSKPTVCGPLAERFLQHGLYLKNWSRCTMRTYRQGLTSLAKVAGEGVPEKAQLDTWVVQMREHGLSPGGCNRYIRTINSYLLWLHEEGQLCGSHVAWRARLADAIVRQLQDGGRGGAARKSDQYAARKLIHLRDVHSTPFCMGSSPSGRVA